MKSPKRTTIYDIAKKLNLNASSVSRALSNQSNVSEATMRLILQTAKELNYKPNSMASNLRKGENKTIGVVVPLINQNFFSNVIAGIEEVTYQNGYNLVICQSNESYEREVKCIETLINQHVSCIIISVTADFQDDNHLKNIKNNLNIIKRFSKNTICPVIKANAYGLGDVEIAKFLIKNKCGSRNRGTHGSYKKLKLVSSRQVV